MADRLWAAAVLALIFGLCAFAHWLLRKHPPRWALAVDVRPSRGEVPSVDRRGYITPVLEDGPPALPEGYLYCAVCGAEKWFTVMNHDAALPRCHPCADGGRGG